ncbi:MAG: hypothetical protein DLM58_20925 [Pseudonocardiales bacterium]|nr:MAG: hypothetical protein DLM58_20925 [Pseudonocardiales bacterium]
MAETPAIEALGLSRSYPAQGGRESVSGLRDVSLQVRRGEVVAITGPSGSGKSTLLFLLAGLDEPDAGSARIGGVDWQTLRGRKRAAFRRRSCGFIAQGMTLLPQATAAENVEVPLVLDATAAADRAPRVIAALDLVGLTEHGAKMPDQLSGGQQQRAAIARAMIIGPAAVLADEPTASLDSATAQDIARLLVDGARRNGTALLLVTHDSTVAAHADRELRLHSGSAESGG